MNDFVSVIDVFPATTLAAKPKRESESPKQYPAIEAAGTMFDAAQLNETNFQNWGHVKPETPEEIIDPLALERLRSRAVYECLNDDALSGMVNVSAESVVHCGPKLQIRIEIDGERDKRLERTVEREWMQWAEDTRYFIKMRTAVKDLRNYGQYFRRLVYNPTIPNGLDVIYHNPTRVANPDGLENGEFVTIGDEKYQVINGVARDRYANEAFYCVLDRPIYPGPYETWNYEWVSHEVMCRLFDSQLSEQPDGFPWATPSLEKGASRRSYEKSEINAARLAASMFGQVVTDNEFMTFFADRMNAPDELPGLEAMRHYSPGRKIRIDNGMFPIMSPGTKIQTFEAEHPHSDFSTFTRTLQRGQGHSLRMPANIATGDYSNTSYASAMKDEQQWTWHREVERNDIEIIDLKPVVIKFVALQSTISHEMSDLASGLAKITKIDFDWRQSDHADPLKQATADALALKTGQKSYPQVWAEKQLDPDAYAEEVLEWIEKMKPVLLLIEKTKLQSRARSKSVAKQS